MTYDTDNGFREISVVLFDGTIATLWWPTSIPIPASYTSSLSTTPMAASPAAMI
jgi:hypothetical protein